MANADETLQPFFAPGPAAEHDSIAAALLHATALMFVAYTGYGRIATLGEEVREPRRTIPRAIIATLFVSMMLYLAVGFVAVSAAGAEALEQATREQAAPLEVIARDFGVPGLTFLIAVGALTAMVGVLLNLILGLSRVMLAMGRRGDLPATVAKLNAAHSTPWVAVLIVGTLIVALAFIGSVKTTWTFSAFTVLIYYAITNAAALALPREARLYPRWIPAIGLIACAFLAFWVPWRIWALGLGLILIGLLWHGVAKRIARTSAASS